MANDQSTNSARGIPERKQVPAEHTWDLGSLYASETQWDDERKTLLAEIEQANSLCGTLGKSPEALLAAMQWLEKTSLMAERVMHYAFLQHAADGGDAANQRRYGMARQAMTAFSAAISFIDPEIQAMDEQLLRSWIAGDAFASHRVMLEKLIRFKPHVLTEHEEKIMALQSEVGGGAHASFGALTNVDLDFGMVTTAQGELPLTQSTYGSFMQQRDRQLRKTVYDQFYGVYDKHKHVLASLYDTSVKQDIFRSKARNYPDSRSMFLFPDQVDASVYDNLIATVHEGFPILHRYYEVRKRMLGVDKLAHYDAYVPLVDGVESKHSYEEAVELCRTALAPLGNEYVQTLVEGLTSGRWVDRYENKGKRSGAFSSGSFTSKPYILLNYKEDVLRDVFTMIHEGGHSMHSWYSVRNNPFPSYDYTIFEAEVASTFNEQLLAAHLLAHAPSDKVAAFVIGKQMDDVVATLFRQTMFAEHEMLVHRQVEQGEPITVDSLRKTYRSLLEAYFGPNVELMDVSDLECLRIPHFYTAFYVYKYATGLSASMALADMVMHGGAMERDRYLSFLKSGGSEYPINALKKAGVDMSKPDPVRSAVQQFSTMLDKFESLMDT